MTCITACIKIVCRHVGIRGFGIRDQSARVQRSGVYCLEFRVQGLGVGLGCRMSGLGSGVQASGFRVYVKGFGLRVNDSECVLFKM